MTTALERGARLHDLSFAGGEWTDPITGLVIPKTLEANLDMRMALRKKCDGSAAARRQVINCCSASILFWINCFVDTFKPLEVGPNYTMRPAAVPDIPWVTWPGQDPVILRVERAIKEGGDLALDKSRNMGASWDCLAPMAHQWLFQPGRSFKLMSRKEELVDNPEDPDALFWKLDYILEHLPEWMVPSRERRHMSLINLDGKSVFHGESTNKHAARGGRRHAILVDEAAAIDQLDSILRSTHMGVACRLFNSTPVGPGAYTNMIFGGKVDVAFLPWWDHPEFGRDREWVSDERGNRYVTSPWREHEVATKSPKEVATNIDIDHLAAGSIYFDISVVMRQRQLFASTPLSMGTLSFGDRSIEKLDAALQRQKQVCKFIKGAGRWKFWIPLDSVTGRPDQERSYTFGADVCHGLGDLALSSNSTIFVIDNDTGEQVAEYADPSIEPGEFARLLAAAGLWFGGSRGCAFVAWEVNGPGMVVGKHLRRLRYPWLYARIDSSGKTEKVTDKLGWFSSREKKSELFGEGRSDMAAGNLIVKSEATLAELTSIVYLPTGAIGPAVLAQEAADALATHGDRATGAMVANHARKRAPLTMPAKVKPPPGTVAEDMEEIEQRQRDEDQDAVDESW